MSAGESLRKLRESLGFTIRDVEAASTRIAERHNSSDYSISLSRLSDIETKEVVPSIYRIYSLSTIYRRDIREFLHWYGIDLSAVSEDLMLTPPPKSHMSSAMDPVMQAEMPLRLDPAFNPRTTMNLGRMIMEWGSVPMAYLAQFAKSNYTYGYVGIDDLTMFPLILPGSFVQIDDTQTRVRSGKWPSEYQRPIYFVETRDGFTVSWCELSGLNLLLKPHPLSPVETKILKYGKEAEILGQVVGIAMRLDSWISAGSGEGSLDSELSNANALSNRPSDPKALMR
jgi:transcriptional regulator with XRE-family HTH domain